MINSSEEDVLRGFIPRYFACSGCGRNEFREYKPLWCGTCQGQFDHKSKPMKPGYLLIMDDGWHGNSDLWDAEFTFLPEGFLLVHAEDDDYSNWLALHDNNGH
jgi:hypothetical protein